MIKDQSIFTRIEKNPEGNRLELHLPNHSVAELAKKKIHDLQGAVRSLGLAVENVKDGYKFDDEYATAKIKTLENALALFRQESETLLEIYLLVK